MTISSTSSSTASTSQVPAADAAQIMVLKKAMNIESSNAAKLLDALPKPAPLPMSGSTGRTIDTTA